MKQKELEIKIEKFSEKGLGIAFDENNNKIVIPKVVINDILLASLNKKSKGIIRGKLLHLISPSSLRTSPICEHFDICGGCIWQNLKYDEQLNQKQNLIVKYFQEDLKNSDIKLFHIKPCENIFEYRNKMEFSFSQNRKKTNFLGLIMHGGRFVVDIQRCHLSSFWFSKVLKNVKLWWEKYDFTAFNFLDGLGFLRTLTIKEGKNTNEKMIILTTSNEMVLSKEQKDDFISVVKEAIREEPVNHDEVCIFLNTQIAEKKKKTTFVLEKLCGNDFIKEDLYINALKENINLTFQIGPFSFFQPNTHQAQNLYSIAIDHLKDENLKDKVIFDLYSGTGTIGMILSKFSKKVIAVEINDDASNQATQNAKLNNINNFEMINADVSLFLNNLLLHDFEKPHVIIVDPPRAGLSDDSIENILKISPKVILYISCNPITQKENIDVLTKNGYQLKILHPVDQFPHTYHIENIAILKKLDFE